MSADTLAALVGAVLNAAPELQTLPPKELTRLAATWIQSLKATREIFTPPAPRDPETERANFFLRRSGR